MLVAVGFWIASYGSRYTLARVTAASVRRIICSRGELLIMADLYATRGPAAPRFKVFWGYQKDAAIDLGRIAPVLGFGRGKPVAGFFLAGQQTAQHSATLLVLPMPFLVALFALLPLVDVFITRRRRRRTRRLAAGLCVRCGDDLRATPRKCPECGAIPVAVNSV